MKAVLYCRVSTADQVQNFSLETQEQACRRYCEAQGYTVDRLFVDKGESAKTAQRTEFQHLLTYCRERRGRLHAVVVYNLTRFSRNTADHHQIAALLRSFGLILRSVTEPIDDSPSGRLMETILAGFSQFDNDVRAQRVVAGMKAAAASGRWVWAPPIGYRAGLARGRGASLLVDPDRAPLIRRAFELVGDGRLTGRPLRDHLVGLGLRTRRGTPIALNRLYDVLRNPVYTARIASPAFAGSADGDWAPIVPLALFERVQRQLDRHAGPIKAALKHVNHPDFPLRRFVRCARCTFALTGSWSSGRHQRYAFYHCRAGCTRVQQADLHARFVTLMDRLTPTPAYLTLLRAHVLRAWREDQDASLARRDRAQQHVKRIEQQLARVDRLFILEQSIDQTSYRRSRDELREELTLARLAMGDHQMSADDVEEKLNAAITALANMSEMWNRAEVAERTRVQEVFFPAGLIWSPDKARFVEPATCLRAFELSGVQGRKRKMVDLTGPTWNRLEAWLEHMGRLPAAA